MGGNGRVLVGVVGAPHGIRGEVRVKSHMAEPTALARQTVFLAPSGGTALKVLSARLVRDDLVVARFEGVTDRDAAAALTGQTLHLDRATLPPPEDDEFYHIDLIGLRAETGAGALVGRVLAVQNFGAGDLLEIAPDGADTLLIPFLKQFVPVVDIEGGRVVIAEEALPTQAEPDAEETRA